VSTLASIAQNLPDIEIIPEAASAVSYQDQVARVVTVGGREISGELIVAADGARSLVREASGIAARSWEYPQSALITTLTVEQRHSDVSTEFHTRAGPFTLVPLARNRMSLVWLLERDRAAALANMPAQAFDEAVEVQAQSIHGRMSADTDRVVIPLRGLLAERFAGHRTMLVGEAAHVFPPIGAQGLNLGLRDVATLARIVRRTGDPGSEAATKAYQTGRQSDVQSRTYAVDLVNRSLLSSFLPVHFLRSGGLAVASAIPALRRFMMHSGLSGLSRAV